ncbi:MAG: response regulator transcription factor [Firmicutes bacterium]|nr:response regulator transcription factor [Bacillota bacterium]
MHKQINILLVDDHPIVRKGLRMLIDTQINMKVIGEAGSVDEAFTIAREKLPELIILDLTLPGQNGIELLKKIREQFPQVKILILTIHDDEDYIRKALTAGANGYLLKKAADDELIMGIKAVMRGEMIVDPLLTKKILQRYILPREQKQKQEEKDLLSKRQKEILILVAQGYTDKQIAEMIHVSVKTVESHKARIKEKLNFVHRSDFVAYAMENNLFSVDLKK